MRAARAWGRLIGAYGQWAVPRKHVHISLAEPLGGEPCIWASWHEANLIAIVAHAHAIRRPVVAFVPGGATGAAMAGWLDVMGVTPIRLSGQRDAGRALRQMRAALQGGHDVLIAVDGPDGPRRRVKAGALWLAAATGAPVRPVGIAALPSLRLPRWDRHIVPLPGARIAAAVGAALRPGRGPRSARALQEIAETLNSLAARAERELRPKRAEELREAA